MSHLESLKRPIMFALPKGNFNKPPKENPAEENKGCVKLLFDLAGYKIEGYEPGKEEDSPYVEELRPFIDFHCMKPKQMPSLLEMRHIQYAIMGRDTAEERYSNIWRSDSEWEEGSRQMLDGSRKYSIKSKKSVDRLMQEGLECLIRGYRTLSISPIRFPIKLPRRPKLPDLETLFKKFGKRTDSDVEKEMEEYLAKFKLPEPPKAFIERYHEKRLQAWNAVQAKFNDILSTPDKTPDKNEVRELIDLGLGRVDIRWIVPPEKKDDIIYLENRVTPYSKTYLVTSYPNLTVRELLKVIPSECIFCPENYIKFFLDKEGYKKYNLARRLHVFPISSMNEAVIKNLEMECLLVDSVSSGETIKKYGLSVVGNPIIKDSTARVYCTPDYLPEELADRAGSYVTAFSNFMKPEESDSYRRYLDEQAKKLKEFLERLKAASIEYGKTRRDSIHYQRGKGIA